MSASFRRGRRQPSARSFRTPACLVSHAKHNVLLRNPGCCMTAVMLQSSLPGIPVRHGKVRDVYDFGDRLLFVASDRISAFDYVLPNGIPRKGEVLTRLSQFWFGRLSVRHHFLTSDVTSLPLPRSTDRPSLVGRSMVVMKTNVVPVECVVRGYLAGSGWKEYRQSGTVCGIPLPPGSRRAVVFLSPIFTPAEQSRIRPR